MKNKTYIYWFLSIFLLLFLGITAFLFPKGIWAYVDLNMLIFWQGHNIDLLYGLFSTLSTKISNLGSSTYFGFDYSQRMSGLGFTQFIPSILIYIFGQKGGFLCTVFLYFTLLFFSAYYFLKIFFHNKTAIFVASLFFCFNIFNIGLINEFSFFLSVPFILVSVIALRGIISIGNVYHYFLWGLSIMILPAYTRILGLYIYSFLFFILIKPFFFYRLFLHNYKKIFFVILIAIILNLPFILSIFYPKESGLGNYLGQNSVYDFFKSQSFISLLSITSVPMDIFDRFSGDTLSFLIILISFIIFLVQKENFVYKKIISIAIIILLFIKSSAIFLNKENFDLLTNKIIPFISNETRWINILIVPLLGIMIAYNIQFIRDKFLKSGYIILILGMIFYNVYHLNYKNSKTLLFDPEKVPTNYLNTFIQSNSQVLTGTLFYPSEAMAKFPWSPYPIPLAYNENYPELFSGNRRFIGDKQVQIREKSFNGLNNSYLNNQAIFNLKNVIFFKDLQNPKAGEFDSFPTEDYVGKSQEYYEKFKSNTGLHVEEENEYFIRFGLKNDDKYEFFLYSPAFMLNKDIDLFFSDSLDIYKKPINIDPTVLQKHLNLNIGMIPQENSNIFIQYKQSNLQPTKIYTKITNFDSRKPFLIQLNQTFGMSWKIKWVDKSYFDEKPCVAPYHDFPITQNSVCEYNAKLMDLEDIRLLNKPQVNEKKHFEGNFIGNAWLITPDDIPETMRGSKELYAVIIYEKQIWYTYSILISGITFLVLFLLTVNQEIRMYFQKKKALKKS